MKISELRGLIRKHHKETFEPLSKLNKKGLMDYASKNGLISEPSVEVVEKPRAEPVRKTVEKPVAEKPRAVDFSNAKAPRVAERVPVMSSKPVAPKSKVAEPKAVEKPKSSYAQFVSAEMKNRPAGVSAKDYMKEIGAKWRESR